MDPQQALTILVVEDDEGIRTITSLLLESEGYRVHAVPNGEAACQWLQQQQPNVLFADVNMPGMSGVEVARRARETYPSLHILLTSGEGRADPAWLAHGVHYLNKPYDRRALLQAIDAVVRSSPAARVRA